jgi:hypothetical protein
MATDIIDRDAMKLHEQQAITVPRQGICFGSLRSVCAGLVVDAAKIGSKKESDTEALLSNLLLAGLQF